MARIKIECSERDKIKLIGIFAYQCPFGSYTEQCGEDTLCSECAKKNIEFVIKSEGDN